MAISTYLSIITLNVNGVNAPVKRHRVAEWIQKPDEYICCLQEAHFRSKDTHGLKRKGQENIFYANEKEKKSGIAILISDKIDLKGCYQRQRKALLNNKGINLSRAYNTCNYLCTQHRST